MRRWFDQGPWLPEYEAATGVPWNFASPGLLFQPPHAAPGFSDGMESS